MQRSRCSTCAPTGPNAHVVAVDPGTHNTYFLPKNVGGRTALHIMSPGPVTAA